MYNYNGYGYSPYGYGNGYGDYGQSSPMVIGGNGSINFGGGYNGYGYNGYNSGYTTPYGGATLGGGVTVIGGSGISMMPGFGY